jgi:dCTP deaminase
MSILADSKILERLLNHEDSFSIVPFSESNLGSNSYDVSLSNKLLVYKNDKLDCKVENETEELLIPESGLTLYPNNLYLACVNEFIDSSDLVPIIEGKSSLARLGLFVHITAGFGDVGYSGYFTLEVTCVKPIVIYPNMKIGQVYFQTTEGYCINPYNKKVDAKYNNKISQPQGSKMHLNFFQEISKLEKQTPEFTKNVDWYERLKDSGISFDPEKLQEDV